MTSMEEIRAEMAAHQELQRTLLRKNKDALFPILAAAGVTEVIVEFNGYADSGQIEGVEFHRGGGDASAPEGKVALEIADYGLESSLKTLDLRSAVEQLAYDAIELDHDGWEDNEGSFGTLTFDIAGNSIALDYNERFESSTYSRHSY